MTPPADDPLVPFHRPLATLALLAAFVAGCQTAPDRTIPDPLPETLEWAIPAVSDAAFLGLDVRENDSGSLESLSFDPGVRVHDVVEHSPAAIAGVQINDVLITFDGTELAVPEDLAAILEGASGGSTATLGLQRGDTVFEVEVTLAASGGAAGAAVREAFVLDPARTRGAWGTNDGAVLVARAEKGPLQKLDIGDRVIELDGKQIVSGRGLVQRLVSRDPGSKVKLTVVSTSSETRTVRVQLLAEGRRLTRFSIPILTTYDATANRERQAFVLIDLYVISLFRFRREGNERHWSFLRFFNFSSGIGELEE